MTHTKIDKYPKNLTELNNSRKNWLDKMLTDANISCRKIRIFIISIMKWKNNNTIKKLK